MEGALLLCPRRRTALTRAALSTTRCPHLVHTLLNLKTCLPPAGHSLMKVRTSRRWAPSGALHLVQRPKRHVCGPPYLQMPDADSIPQLGGCLNVLTSPGKRRAPPLWMRAEFLLMTERHLGHSSFAYLSSQRCPQTGHSRRFSRTTGASHSCSACSNPLTPASP